MTNPAFNAYLDIETTGLSWYNSDITVIGIYLDNGIDNTLIQLVADDATEHNLLEALEGVHTIYTYNGSRFDLPFIHASLGLDLAERYRHHDLMYDCWRRNLYGGFKAVEQQLGIHRELRGIGGLEAVMLWFRYRNNGDQKSLATLLQYNREDVVNLRTLKERLLVPIPIETQKVSHRG